MCEFCRNYDWGTTSYEIDKHGARLVHALGSYRFSPAKQLKFCPICGSRNPNQSKNTDLISRKKLQERLEYNKAGPANKRYTEGWNDCMSRVKSMVSTAAPAAWEDKMPSTAYENCPRPCGQNNVVYCPYWDENIR